MLEKESMGHSSQPVIKFLKIDILMQLAHLHNVMLLMYIIGYRKCVNLGWINGPIRRHKQLLRAGFILFVYSSV